SSTFLPPTLIGGQQARRQGKEEGAAPTASWSFLSSSPPPAPLPRLGGLAAMADTNPDAIKRYTPPVHRNRASNRRKSGDRADKANYSYNNDGEKRDVPSLKNLPPIVHHETFFSSVQNDYNQTRLVPLEGCSTSEASQLLSDRWTAAMNLYNDQTVDSSEKPVMYSGSTGSSWGHLKLPHQMNFLEELRHAVDAHTDIGSPVDSWN
ncbi:unnamed protein product, partial [Urochloa humidicola]